MAATRDAAIDLGVDGATIARHVQNVMDAAFDTL